MTYQEFTSELENYTRTGVLNGFSTFMLTANLLRDPYRYGEKQIPCWSIPLVEKPKTHEDWGREERDLTLEHKEMLCRYLMEMDALSDLCRIFERRVWFDGDLYQFIRDEKVCAAYRGELDGITFMCMCSAARWMATIQKGEETEHGYGPGFTQITLIADEKRPDILNKKKWDPYIANFTFLNEWDRISPHLHNMGVQSFYGKRVEISAMLEMVMRDWKAFNLSTDRKVGFGI